MLFALFINFIRSSTLYSVHLVESLDGEIIKHPAFDNMNYVYTFLKEVPPPVAMPIPKIVSQIMKKESYEYVVKDVKYVIYPLKEMIQVKNGKSKCLGKFEKIGELNGYVTIKFGKGDYGIGNQSYVSYVQFVPSPTLSFKKYFLNGVGEYGFKLSSPDFQVDEKEYVIGLFKNEPKKNESLEKIAEALEIGDNQIEVNHKNDNEKNDHEKNDHEKKDHEKNDHEKKDHEKNDHEKNDHEKNDHEKKDSNIEETDEENKKQQVNKEKILDLKKKYNLDELKKSLKGKDSKTSLIEQDIKEQAVIKESLNELKKLIKDSEEPSKDVEEEEESTSKESKPL